jgi:hypothetical protein
VRQAESSIPPDEELYRRVSSDEVKGDDVLWHGVEVPACSFNRAAYSEPEDVLREDDPARNGIAKMNVRDIPEPIVQEAPANSWAFFVADDPNPPEDPENDAHAEVRLHVIGQEYDKDRKVTKTARMRALEALARRLKLHKYPVPLQPPDSQTPVVSA